jgi:ArsR family transcriptional regulator
VDDQIYEMQVRICKAFANSSWLRMLDLLAIGERTVSDLQGELGITTANVSQHLAILKAAGVVTTRREGKQIYCSLTIPEAGILANFCCPYHASHPNISSSGCPLDLLASRVDRRSAFPFVGSFLHRVGVEQAVC